MVAKATGTARSLMAASRPHRRTCDRSSSSLPETRDRGLRDELVEIHLGLALQLARRFANRGESYDDLVAGGLASP